MPNYVSMTKKQFKDYDYNEVSQMQVKDIMTSDDVGQTHFKMGHDTPTYSYKASDNLVNWRSPTPQIKYKIHKILDVDSAETDRLGSPQRNNENER